SASVAAIKGKTVSLSNASWTIALVPVESSVTTVGRAVAIFGVLVSILLYVCAAVAQMAARRAGQLEDLNAKMATENLERSRAEENIARLNQDLQRRLDE